MSKKPKILHIILDGFSPSNQDDPWDCFRDVIDKSVYHVSSFVGGNPDPDARPHSPDMWTRAYSKTKFEDILQEDDFRITVGHKIRRVPSENFIWNKLSKSGIPSWIYPYGQYYQAVGHNVLNDDSNNVNGIIKMYGTNLSYAVDNGKAEWYRSKIGTYYGLHEMARTSYIKGTVFESYIAEWKNPSEEFLARVPYEVHDFLDKVFSEHLESNTKLFQDEILPHLKSHVDEMEDGGYVHIGLVETDVPMHYAVVYPDIMSKVRTYIEYVINEAIEIVNPDLLILTGDHGMCSVREYLSDKKTRKPVVSLNYNGKSRDAIQAFSAIAAPIYVDHSHEIGGVFCSKDPNFEEEFKENYFNNSPYLMYDIHDYIVDKLTL